MALGMRHWLGLVAVGFLLVAVWRLPPQPLEPTSRALPTHEEVRHMALSRELARATASLRSLRWADSLTTFVAGADRQRVTVVAPAELEQLAELEEVREQLDRRARALAPPRADLRLLYVYQPVAHGLPPEVRVAMGNRTETHVGVAGGEAFCMRIRTSAFLDDAIRHDRAVLRGARTSLYTPLGACEFYARHGLPGDGVARWLERGGAGHAVGNDQRRVELRYGRGGRSTLFGTTVMYVGPDRTMDLDRCLAGLEDACEALFLEPTWRRGATARAIEDAAASPALTVRDYSGALGTEGALLLADLERELGSEAFAAFWRSDRPVEEAFERAFGVPPGRWLVGWMDDVYGIDPPGPRLARADVLGTLLALSLFGAFATLRTRKRRLR